MDIISNILKNEIFKALGCTEVLLIGKAAFKAKPENIWDIEEIVLTLSKDVFKNAYAVGVPNTGKFGIIPAIVGGLLSIDENKIFEIEKYDEEFEKYIKDKIKINVVNGKVYCKITIKADKIYTSELREYKKNNINKEIKDEFKNLNLNNFLKYIENIPKDVENLINEVIEINYSLTNPKVPEDFIKIDFKDEIFSYVLEKSISAIYNRMIGINKPAMAIAGSGNMGLSATVPIIAYDEITNKDRDRLIKSITLSALSTIYSTYYSGYTSAMCGCVNRGGLGALVGLSYYLDKDIDTVVKSFTANLPGIICDGGKVGCALKIASGIFSIFLSLNSKCPGNNGIVGKDFKSCIENINKIGIYMDNVDNAIIEILKNKEE